jgi:hypothetical protein
MKKLFATTGKLTLHRETLRLLDRHEVASVLGGAGKETGPTTIGHSCPEPTASTTIGHGCTV